MLYTVSKQIGAMAVALWGKAEVIILTGGIAYSKYCVEEIKKQVGFLAPVVVLPVCRLPLPVPDIWPSVGVPLHAGQAKTAPSPDRHDWNIPIARSL